MKPNFFAAGSPYLNHPLLTADRTRAEVEFALSQLNVAQGARLLDIGCGFGRHTIELARRGYQAVGIDPSEAMIDAARKRAKEAFVSPTFAPISGTKFGSDEVFDAAICLFTTLGQMDEAGDNRALLQRMKRVVRENGRFLLELPQRHVAVQTLKPSDHFGNDTQYTAITRTFAETDSVVTETFKLVTPESEQTFLLRYRLFSHAALLVLLADAGLKTIETFGGYDGSPLTDDSMTMLLLGSV